MEKKYDVPNKEQLNTNKELKYMLILAYYFVIAQMLLILLVVPFLNKLIKPEDDSLAYYNVLDEVLYDKDSLTLIDDETYEYATNNFKMTGIVANMTFNEYQSYDLIYGGTYEGYHIIFNSFNTVFNSKIDGSGQIDPAFIDALLLGEAKFWYENVPIRVYVANSTNIPNPFIEHQTSLNSKPFKLVSVQASNYVSVLNFIYFIVLLIPMLYILKHELFDDVKKFKKLDKEHIIFGTFILFAASIGLNLLTMALKNLFNLPLGISANQRAIEAVLVFPFGIFMIIAAILFGPLVEEIVFRHVSFKLIKNPKIALFVSSFVFGIIHVLAEPNLLYGIAQGLAYIGLGFVLGALYLKNHQNLTSIYLIHAAYNAISMILAIL